MSAGRPVAGAGSRANRLGVLWPAVLAAAGVAAAAVASRGGHSVPFDAFRDMAWTHALLQGRGWADPVLLGEPAWYAPGGPLLMAAVAALTGLPVATVHASSALWWNGLLPLLLALVVARAVDRTTALVAVPMVGLGSLWWLTHFAAAMPSVQGVALTLATFLLWQRSLAAELAGEPWRGRAVACGAVLAAAAWYHPLCAMVAAAAIAGHGAALAVARRDRSRLGPVVVVAGVAALLAAPLTVHLLLLPRANPTPLRYVAAELLNPDFALHLHAPLLLPLAAVGAVAVARRGWASGWLLAYLAAALAGQALGYLSSWSGGAVPCLLPHEWQWHGQVAVGVLAAAGAVDLTRRAAARWAWPRDRWLRWLLWLGATVVATLTPATAYLDLAGAYLVDLRPLLARRGDTVAWLEAATAPGDVVAAERLPSHLLVAGLAGRRAVAVPVGFMNPAVDPATRFADLDCLLTTGDGAEAAALAARYRVAWLLVVVDSAAAESLRQRADAWSWLERAHVAPDGSVVAYRVCGGERPPGG